MKLSTLQPLSLLAVPASALLIPVSPAAAGVALTATGLAAVLLADYGRRPARSALAAPAASRRQPRFAAPYAA
jgi:hypothetical protein